ncbi:hypothetical protein EG329_010287 [Mollisiaceae sp. DMI_Dod_QoI]|nr:hypothetical protein EG329_010287 [Helotiales sp. DMI_Dod_QoI]
MPSLQPRVAIAPTLLTTQHNHYYPGAKLVYNYSGLLHLIFLIKFYPGNRKMDLIEFLHYFTMTYFLVFFLQTVVNATMGNVKAGLGEIYKEVKEEIRRDWRHASFSKKVALSAKKWKVINAGWIVPFGAVAFVMIHTSVVLHLRFSRFWSVYKV